MELEKRARVVRPDAVLEHAQGRVVIEDGQVQVVYFDRDISIGNEDVLHVRTTWIDGRLTSGDAIMERPLGEPDAE